MRPHSLQRTISFVSILWFPLPLLPSAVLGEGGWHVHQGVHQGVHGNFWTTGPCSRCLGRALHVINTKFTLCFTFACLGVFPRLMLLWCADLCMQVLPAPAILSTVVLGVVLGPCGV